MDLKQHKMTFVQKQKLAKGYLRRWLKVSPEDQKSKSPVKKPSQKLAGKKKNTEFCSK